MENYDDMSDFSMLDLFRLEVENQVTVLNDNLLALETSPNASDALESLMRAAHSIKGAARIVGLDAAVSLAHIMEDCFVAAQSGSIALTADNIDVLLQAVDLFQRLAQIPETHLENWLAEREAEIENLIVACAAIEVSELVGATHQLPLPQPPAEDAISSKAEVAQNSDDSPATEPQPETINLDDFSMLDLFRLEVETQTEVLSDNLLALETTPNASDALESLMRAAHSIKGAARIVGVDAAVNLAHVMEDCFVAAQSGSIALTADNIDVLLQAVDLFQRLAQIPETHLENWLSEREAEIENLVGACAAIAESELVGAIHELPLPAQPALVKSELVAPKVMPAPSTLQVSQGGQVSLRGTKQSQETDRVVRVSAENLNRLMGLAGESLVEANWLQPFSDSLLKLKNQQTELSNILEKLQESLGTISVNQAPLQHLNAARQKANECRQILTDKMSDLELFARRSSNLSDRLYREVIASHMRPFADLGAGFPRMVRDLARQLGKQIKLEIIGKSTLVDRDILDKLEAPLTHILRNAIDHGIELPSERLAAGKPPVGTICLEASHRAGMLSITVSDDGRGVDLERLRQKIIAKNMVSADMAAKLTETELMEFLFLPGFSTATAVTEISGRGVGLDIVQSMAQQVDGRIVAVSQPGKGMSFHLQLPLTLSVIRTLVVEISGEPYAFPLTRIERIVMVPTDSIALAENHQYFTIDDRNIGLVSANQVLQLPESSQNSEALPVIVISDRLSRYGLVVTRFLGECKLVVRPLDTRLGKVPDISAVALMSDGSPVLIMDVEDLIRSIDKLLASGQLNKITRTVVESAASKHKKRILVVDDSITVREMERKLLENKGYSVEIAVNGMDGWNAVRTGHYDLVVTDVDMPRMNGFELVSQIKTHQTLNSLPVIIVSYKDRESDRIRGLEVGANYYLTKSSFNDDTLVNAVADLIGE